MPDRPRQPLPFGGGLDRSTGPLVVEPTSYRDLRNVRLSEGWMSVRQGLAKLLGAADFTAADAVVGPTVTHIVAIAAVRSQGVNVVITYQSSTTNCAAWLLVGSLATLTYIGSFWTIGGGAAVPPVVSVADSYDKLFVAHDEPSFVDRQKTQVVDVSALTVATLNGGATLGDFQFRIVRRYLNYLFGAGHGTAADPNRPEIVRNSIAGDPLTWDENHYFVAGQRGDPVLALDASGDVLKARKQTESYDIIGFSPDTFGIKPGDRLFGIAGTQLSVTVGHVSYFWSLEGPRADAGAGESQDLALLLALAGPVPDPLASGLDYVRGFAVYQPITREVRFIFGQWCFTLHLTDEQRKRWSYTEYGVALACGGIVFQSTIDTGLTAHAEMIDPSGVTSSTIAARANLVGALIGDEVAEWWLRDPSTLIWSVKATTAAPSSPIAYTYTGLLPETFYFVAVRLKRFGLAGAGYTSSNPEDWPSSSRRVIATDPSSGPPGPGGSLGSTLSLTQTGGTGTTADINADLDGGVDGTETIDWIEITPDGITGWGVTPAPTVDPDVNPFTYDWTPDSSGGRVLAARLNRGGAPTAPYVNDDPYTWPAESRIIV